LTIHAREDAYLDELGRFAAEVALTDLSDRAHERIRWVVADSIPVIGAGMQVGEMQALVATHLQRAAPGNAWVIGTGRQAAALDAALLNGTAGTWLELDEGNLYAKGHPGIQVVPATLAVAQESAASGADLLLAVSVGYEVSSRVSRAARVRLAVHPHGTYGVIGAAVAVGRLRRFDRTAMRQLINVAATMGMATSRQTLREGATVRNIYTGHSGLMGIMAVRLVEAGFTGERDGVRSIFGQVLSDGFDPDRAVEGLGREWLLADGYFKLHPTGRYVHSAIDALEDALAKVPGGRLDVDHIDRIDVRAYKLAAFLGGTTVTSSFGARFSVPFALATILHHGQSGLDSFGDAAVANPTVQALTARVAVEEDPAFTASYPAQQRCIVTLRMKDGRTLTGECTVTKGEPSNPHKPGELERKFFELGVPIWGKTVTDELYHACMTLDTVPSVEALARKITL
jgi:2-methylcitrate dehydratase PrpD